MEASDQTDQYATSEGADPAVGLGEAPEGAPATESPETPAAPPEAPTSAPSAPEGAPEFETPESPAAPPGILGYPNPPLNLPYETREQAGRTWAGAPGHAPEGFSFETEHLARGDWAEAEPSGEAA